MLIKIIIMLTSILEFNNKSLTISTFSFSIAECNAAVLNY